jgi:hypothetical protein
MDKIKITQKLLEKYGFSFLSYGEDGVPLFTAPNGKIVSYDVVYDFISQQELQAKQNEALGRGGFEGMPRIPEVPVDVDRSNRVEFSNVESSHERKKEQIEKNEVVTENKRDSLSKAGNYKNFTPKMAVRPKDVPFGEGFYPSSFDPSSVDESIKFVNTNKHAANSDSNKWLAVLFDKFLKKYEDGTLNN